MLSDTKKRQFRALFQQFLFRIVDLELIAPEGDLTKLVGQFASLLVFFSVIMALIALFTGSPPPGPRGVAQSWGLQHFLIATTMLVVGLFAVLSWGALLPDRRDLMVLAPLPIPATTFLLAKVAAVATALGATVLALNVFSGIISPLFWIPQSSGFLGFVRCMAAYWTATFASGIFVFGAVLGLQGLTTQLLSRRMFLRLSAFLQVFAFTLFLSMYFLEPNWAYPGALSAQQNQAALVWLPSYWFLGLFQALNGSVDPAILRLAGRALIGTLITGVASGMAFLLCYLYGLRKIVEAPDIAPARKRVRFSVPLGNSRQTAVALFSMRTLLRSRQHRAIVCFYLGVGFAIVILYLKTGIAQKTLRDLAASGSWRQPGVPLLVSSVVLICAAVLGTRVAFSMPADFRANWIFRVLPLRDFSDWIHGACTGVLLLCCLPFWSFAAVLFLFIWPWRPALLHLGILAMLALVLTEASVLGFRKIPFTCSYLPGKSNVYLTVWVYTMLGIPLLDLSVRFEWHALQNSKISILIMIGLALVAVALKMIASRLTKHEQPEPLFEEAPEPAIFALDLHRDGELIGYGAKAVKPQSSAGA